MDGRMTLKDQGLIIHQPAYVCVKCVACLHGMACSALQRAYDSWHPSARKRKCKEAVE